MDFYYFDPESKTTLHTTPYRPDNHRELLELNEIEYIMIGIVRRISVLSVTAAIGKAMKLLGDV